MNSERKKNDITSLINSSQITTKRQEIIRAIKRADIQMLLDLHIFSADEAEKKGESAVDFTFTPEGMTPLMFACAQGNMNIINLILSAPGIDLHRTDK
jgi:ankyrin repeat protein